MPTISECRDERPRKPAPVVVILISLGLWACAPSDQAILVAVDARANPDVQMGSGMETEPDGVCGDGQCLGRETILNCPQDCGAGQGTLEFECGDGHCQEGETALGCPADCSALCGDGVCSGGDENTDTCPSDCVEVCGDSLCAEGEDGDNCPQDCGIVEAEEVCGDGACKGGESSANCVQDCGAICGDGVCNGPETVQLCLEDCKNKSDPPEVGGGFIQDGDTIHFYSNVLGNWCGAPQDEDDPMGCDTAQPGFPEKFEITRAEGSGPVESGDVVHLYSKETKRWCAADNDTNHPLQCNRSDPGSWEKFVVFKESGTASVNDGDIIHLFSAKWTMWCGVAQGGDHSVYCNKLVADEWVKLAVDK